MASRDSTPPKQMFQVPCSRCSGVALCCRRQSVLCEKCRLDARRACWRKAAEKKRRANGIKKHKGVKVQCAECGSSFVKGSIRAKRCPPCRIEVGRARARARRQDKCRAQGYAKLGSTKAKCGCCGSKFVMLKPRQKYCQLCKQKPYAVINPEYAEKQKKYKQRWVEKNRERVNSVSNNWRKRERKRNPMFVLRDRIRARIGLAFRAAGGKKSRSTLEILGAPWKIVREHIEAQFHLGMSWENRDKWHIDHIIPVSVARTEAELIKLNHYTNLQPLWAADNLRKNKKLNWVA